MRRFFVDPENIMGQTADITGTEARHISTILRLSPGTTVTLFDGSGSYYEARLTKISPSRVAAKIVSIIPYIDSAEEYRTALHLGIGLLKGKKMDFIIQKLTELGIENMLPFRSKFCAAHEPSAGKLLRWKKIALEACKQCNRPVPPALQEVTDFNDLVSFSKRETYDLKLIFWEEEVQKNLRQALESLGQKKSVLALIGPEGGFSAGEVADAVGAGFQPVTVGSRILRAETAAIASASILQYELGNLS